MPGRIGFTAYCNIMRALPGTTAELAQSCGLLPKSTGELLRRFWALGLVHPGGVEGNDGAAIGGRSATVWHAGRGVAASKRVKPKCPRAAYIVFASIIRALDQARTTRELAEEVGISVVLAQDRVKRLHEAGLVHIPEWASDACGRQVARYEWGAGKDAKKRPALTGAQKYHKGKARQSVVALAQAWRLAA